MRFAASRRNVRALQERHDALTIEPLTSGAVPDKAGDTGHGSGRIDWRLQARVSFARCIAQDR
jgi:hypothetical protein